MDTALSTRDLVAGYEPDLPIVRGVGLAVARGELVVLLGPNGAGKSTLVKAIAGLVPVHSGTMALGAADITAVPAHEKIRHGLAFVPQTENIFATLSIHDNLRAAADILPKDRRARRIAALYAMFPDLAARPSLRAGQLSGGQRQMLAINRAGVTIVLVEQNVKAALAIADRAVILVEGQVRHEGPAAGLADDPIVAELYLGARRQGAAP
jgi:branched-chain amino acid transport system ATP-binding protein